MVKLRLAERGAQHSTQAQRWPGHASFLFFILVLNRAAGKKTDHLDVQFASMAACWHIHSGKSI